MARGRGQSFRPYIIGDSAFQLTEFMMKAYPGMFAESSPEFKFNKKFNGACVTIEHAFGRLKSRFRVLLTAHMRCPSFAAMVTRVACALHNMIERRNQWKLAGDELATVPWVVDRHRYLAGDDTIALEDAATVDDAKDILDALRKLVVGA